MNVRCLFGAEQYAPIADGHTRSFEWKGIGSPILLEPRRMRRVCYRAQDTSAFPLMSCVGLFEHFIYRIRVQTPRNVTSCLVCYRGLSVSPAVFLPDSSCHCHGFAILNPIRIIWDEASYSFRSSSASIFTQISLFSSKSNNVYRLLHTCRLPALYIHLHHKRMFRRSLPACFLLIPFM